MSKSPFLFLSVLASVLIVSDASAGEPWGEFLQKPDAGSRKALSAGIDPSRCDWGSPANAEVVPDLVRGPLFELTSQGNENAFLIGLSAVRCFDGGDLEDFYQSAGKFMERHPQRFLTEVTERNVASSEVVSMVVSVFIVDDNDAKLQKIVQRIALLREVNDEKVARLQAESVRALQEREEDLRKMKASMGEAK